MTIQEILKHTHHRPWPLPKHNWKYYQEWNDVIFLHWKVDINVLREFVPPEIEIDTFEGAPWVSLVAFTMEKVRMRNVPSFAPVSCFHEVNIRTYARYKNKTGVYFLSIEGGTASSCWLAKAMSQLPYRYSAMKRLKGQYRSHNPGFADKLEVEFEIGLPKKDKNLLDRWLTERYALFQNARGSINEFDIHHLEWPTHQIIMTKLELKYARFENLLCRMPDIAHYSTGVQVLGWDMVKNKR